MQHAGLNDTMVAERILTLYGVLAQHLPYEPHWWPIFSADQPFEVVVGAVLVQQTRWEAVEAAVLRLIGRGWLAPAALASADTGELAALIRPCAFPTQKAPGLQAIARHLLVHHQGDAAALLRQGRADARRELLALPRVGRETADTIMLYAGQHPLFIVDAYARRLFDRLGVFPELDVLHMPYDALQDAVELPFASWAGPIADAPTPHAFFWRLHALIDEACIHHCLTAPRCDLPGARRSFAEQRKCAEHCVGCAGCPLRGLCRAYRAA